VPDATVCALSNFPQQVIARVALHQRIDIPGDDNEIGC